MNDFHNAASVDDIAYAAIRDKFNLEEEIRLMWAKDVRNDNVLDYTGLYAVSSAGEVYSLKNGNVNQLRHFTHTNGYYQVCLLKDGKQRTTYTHRLVCVTFLGVPQQEQEACHIDGVRTNNKLENLRWGSDKENNADKKRHGTNGAGERGSNTKLTAVEAQAIINEFNAGGVTQKELATRYGVNQTHVSQILSGSTWTGLVRINTKPLTATQRDKCLQVIELYEKCGKTFQEIATVLGIAKSSACMLYNRAAVCGLVNQQ